MIYEPFETIEEVEPFFEHSVYIDGKELTVVGASYEGKPKALYIQAVDNNGEELSMSAMNWFYSARYKGLKFGRRIKNEKV